MILNICRVGNNRKATGERRPGNLREAAGKHRVRNICTVTNTYRSENILTRTNTYRSDNTVTTTNAIRNDNFRTSKSTCRVASLGNTGNTLLFTVMVVSLVLLAAATGYTFYSAAVAQSELEHKLQMVALLTARLLNAHDQAGQINNMTAASRQLCFNARRAYNTAASPHPEIEALATEVVNESRVGSQMLASERINTLSTILADVSTAITIIEKDENNNGPLFIAPWVSVSGLMVDDCWMGYRDGSDSNVPAPGGNQPLLAHDQGFINDATRLYQPNLNLTLTAPDADLNFPIAAMPAPVDGTIAPLRLLSNDKFHRSFALIKDGQKAVSLPGEFFPSAIQIKGHQTITMACGFKFEQAIGATATASTSGASPMP